MKTYAITLERSAERSGYIRDHLAKRLPDYEIVRAVDGKLLTEQEKSSLCDMEIVRQAPWWLNDGAIGCALSHRRALERFLATESMAAFIVEDDVVLPENIGEVLRDIERRVRTDEVILLYYASFETIDLSTKESENVVGGSLYYPVRGEKILTATAYVIGREAAEKMYDAILPIRVTADSWFHFYKLNCFRHFRLLYPMIVRVHHFKSSIDYLSGNTISARLASLIDRYRIPGLFQLLRYRRKVKLERMLRVRTSDQAPMRDITT